MIGGNAIVRLRYTMKNGRGEVLEDRTVTYRHGSPSISPILQAQLQGLNTGDQKQVFLKKGQEDADDDFTFDVTVEAIGNGYPPDHTVSGTPVKIHLLGGFLGSGKTTAIREACRYLVEQAIPVAVITNDQGAHLVDGELFTQLGIPSGQVRHGCFCCNYNDLQHAIRHLADHHSANADQAPAVIFAESVGSCTDLIATVLKPLLRQHPEWQPTISVFADAQLLNSETAGFDETIDYIYNKQLEEAKLIVVSKLDQLEDPEPLKAKLQNRYPGKTILYQNSFDETHIARWLQTLDTIAFTQDLPSLDIDYDTYGAGEAKLAWLDQQLEIESPTRQAQHAALALIETIAKTTSPIGHLKCLLDGHTKISYTATTAPDPSRPHANIPVPTASAGHPTQRGALTAAGHPAPQPAARASLLINARIQTDPQTLAEHVAAAMAAIEHQYACKMRIISKACFQPGYPRPTHRLA